MGRKLASANGYPFPGGNLGHRASMIADSSLEVDEHSPSWQRPLRQISMSDWIIVVTAVLIMVNSVSICVGWWTRSRSLVLWFADDTPIHFNTAVGFILLGFGELSLVLRRRDLVNWAAGAVLVLAGTEMAEWILGVDIGIDTLLAVPFVGGDGLHPGRMSPNTAACFLLVGGAQVLMSRPGRRAAVTTTAAVIMKTVAGGIAFIALLGYVVRLKWAYGWSESVGMGVASWSGFLLIIAARIAALWKRDIIDEPRLPNWFLPFLGTAVLSLSIGLIWVFNSVGARPFMVDPIYASSAQRISVTIVLSVGTLILLGTISVLATRHKAMMALQHADELRVQMMKRAEAERELSFNNQNLARSNRDLEDFAYVASHDLKAPLRGIDNAAKWLEEDLHDSLSDDSRNILSLMRNRINRMEKLLDDLLTYSRAGRTDTAITETNVRSMIDNIIQVLSPPAHIAVRVEGELPVIVTASAQLEQVLRNLINNAIKHHDKQQGEVVVSCVGDRDAVEFFVRDDGPGIAPEFHDRIFKLFQTLKRRDEVEGSGMGLAVVKKLVEQQNTGITVHSQGDGKGTEFRFKWPVQHMVVEETADARA
jgi:signal transduction histidine kinase